MKNRSVDGLRGIAAFNVAVSHFVAAFCHQCFIKITRQFLQKIIILVGCSMFLHPQW